MGKTHFDVHNSAFSSLAHLLARRLIYPSLFGVSIENIDYEEETLVGESDAGDILDGSLGIDRIVKVKIPGAKPGRQIAITVQERFRRPQYLAYQDITITEWNNESNMPSELYKIRADVFLYGYANHNNEPTGFLDVVAIDTTRLLIGIANRSVKFDMRQNPKKQDFITVKLKDIKDQGGLVLWQKSNLNSPGEMARKMFDKYDPTVLSEVATIILNAIPNGDTQTGGQYGD